MENNEYTAIIENEKLLLSAILLGGISIKERFTDKGVKPDFFLDKTHKNIFSVMGKMENANIGIDTLSFLTYVNSNKLAKKDSDIISYVSSLTNNLTSNANIDYYISVFINNYKRIEAKKKISELSELLKNEGNVSVIQEDLEKAIQDLNDLNNNVFFNLTAEDYEKTNAYNDLSNFITDIENKNYDKPISTGFKNLDAILDGGLSAGLYTIGAISSGGKTTLCLQIADQIAAAGNDVLIFSLEMAKKELIAKSLARQSFLITNGDKNKALTTRSILKGLKSEGSLFNEKIELANKSIGRYASASRNVFFNIGVGDIGINQIEKITRTHIQQRKKTPVVIVDYLQILAPWDLRASDKQNIDHSVLQLKRLSRDYKLPVIAISSFNRDSYTDPVNMTCFKESGAIEYTSDVLLGLQYKGMDKDPEKDYGVRNKKIVSIRENRIINLINENEKKAAAGDPVYMELKILKNRTGSKGKIDFKYFPKFEYFQSWTYQEPGIQQNQISKSYLTVDYINNLPVSKITPDVISEFKNMDSNSKSELINNITDQKKKNLLLEK